MRGNSFVFHGAPTHPLSGKGSNMAFFGLTTFLLAARPCRVVSKKNKKMNPTKKTLKRFTKKHRHRHRTHNDTDLWDGGSCCVRRIRANRLACRLGFVVHRVLQLATNKNMSTCRPATRTWPWLDQIALAITSSRKPFSPRSL